jgi:hypothetical protein
MLTFIQSHDREKMAAAVLIMAGAVALEGEAVVAAKAAASEAEVVVKKKELSRRRGGIASVGKSLSFRAGARPLE